MPLAVQNKSCSHMSTATECVSCMCIGLEVFSIVQQRLSKNVVMVCNAGGIVGYSC